MRKCRIGTAKFFTLLLLLYHTSANLHGLSPERRTSGGFIVCTQCFCARYTWIFSLPVRWSGWVNTARQSFTCLKR
ncbi:hypothetical protein DW194_14925 [Subdoligranulum sp. AM16-9]|nr:hypothetical protein DW194_14925 [Subdoligranulum sp. AM16-9]